MKPLIFGYAAAIGVIEAVSVTMLVAQANPEPLSGGAGWVGAGLLGLVLCWLLLKHLPDKDRQLENFIKSRDADKEAARQTFANEQKENRAANAQAIQDMQRTFAQAVNDMMTAFANEQRATRETHGQEMKEMRSLVVTVSDNFRTAVHDIRGTGQAVVSQAGVAVAEAKQLVEQAQAKGKA